MKELGMVLLGCLAFTGFFAGVIYPDLEVKGYSNIKSCNGECYEAYVAKYGTVVEIERAKAELQMSEANEQKRKTIFADRVHRVIASSHIGVICRRHACRNTSIASTL